MLVTVQKASGRSATQLFFPGLWKSHQVFWDRRTAWLVSTL